MKCQAKEAEEFTTPKMVEEALRAISAMQITRTMQKIATESEEKGAKAIANDNAMEIVQMT